jgi:threonine dehydratase
VNYAKDRTGVVSMISVEDIRQARERIKHHIKKTPLRKSKFLSNLIEGEVFLKLESEQVTGSFKVRGALNRLMTLSEEEASRGIITASTGNHGLGIAFAAKQLGISAKIVYPTDASVVKLKKMKDAGVEVVQEVGYAEIESYARRLADEQGLTYVSPYNDSMIVAGAGTTGLEILEQHEAIQAVIVPIGGGGLISGIASAVKRLSPQTEMIGVQSEASPEVYESWRAGHWVHAEESDSLAQGLMGGVEPDAITLDLIQELLDRIVLVKEKAILMAIRILYEEEKLLIEGAGAASTAVLLENALEFIGKRLVLVVSGGNISEDEIVSLLS